MIPEFKMKTNLNEAKIQQFLEVYKVHNQELFSAIVAVDVETVSRILKQFWSELFITQVANLFFNSSVVWLILENYLLFR